MLNKVKAFAKNLGASVKYIAREVVASLPGNAVVFGFLTLFSYLVSEGDRLLTGHYFHWLGAAVIAFFGSSLLKTALPEIAKGWHTGRISAERSEAQRQAHAEYHQFIDELLAAANSTEAPARDGAYL